jgi:hypothetical protein
MNIETQNESQESAEPPSLTDKSSFTNLTLYAIINSEGEIISIKNRKIHLTRKDVRMARDTYNRRNAKIVRGNFTLNSSWTFTT